MKINLDISDASELTERELIYLRDNPSELRLFVDREVIYRAVLIKVLVLALICIATSKLVSYQFADELSRFINDVVVDTIFEIGAALLGAVATVFFIELQQKRQFDENVKLRHEIDKRISEL